MDSEWHDSDDETDIRVRIFRGHKGEVNSCCLSLDYNLLVTAADDARLIIWNVSKQSPLCELTGHTGPVNCCVFSPDNKSIASASYDSTIRIWETATSRCMMTLSGHSKSIESVCYSHDGAMLCSASWDKTLLVWDSKNGDRLYTLVGHRDCVKTCTFSVIGCLIASGGWDKHVRVWNLKPTIKDSCEQSKWLLRRYEKLSDCDVYVAVMKGHKGNVQTVAFSIAGLLASGSWDRVVCLWNPYRVELLKKFIGHTGWVKAVSFSTNSIELVSSADDDTVRVWNVISGKCNNIFPAQTDLAQSCIFSTSGNIITSGSALLAL